MVTFDLEIVPRLKIQPEAIIRAEVARGPERRVSRDGPGPVDNLIDPARRHTDVFGDAILREPERLEKVEREDLAGVDCARACDWTCGSRSVVIAELDVVRVAVFPAEADPPLIVDANTVLARHRLLGFFGVDSFASAFSSSRTHSHACGVGLSERGASRYASPFVRDRPSTCSRYAAHPSNPPLRAAPSSPADPTTTG